MASDALRRLAARLNSTHTISAGDSGDRGDSLEKSGLFRPHDCPHAQGRGDKNAEVVPTRKVVGTTVGTENPNVANDVPSVPSVPTKNDRGGNAAGAATASGLSTEPGLSPYTIRDLANWYEEEGDRRRIALSLDQRALDRDLRRLLSERGVFPEFIWVEFERVMQRVFAPPR